ncbi:MAG: Zn-dependent hydrolase [Alphaproteobacteria bacterium]|nr:Zn-dependent hydrolase [Alphaproteobacteria bacterium]
MPATLPNLRINSDRLWASLMELAQIGATAKGGVCRLALTDLDRQARDLFIRWCEEAGCTVTVDGIGNIFARRSGRDNALPPVMTGSHIDTQPTGGKFDGAYGVMAGLEVVRTLNEADFETDAPVEIVVWTNEEGTRFAPAMIGSGAFAKVFDLSKELGKTDLEGKTIGGELERIGYNGATPVGGRKIGAYFEAHIEQGPILEAESKTIGIVTGAQGQRWYEVTVVGQEAHAGPTPMVRRKDALVAASRMIDRVNRIGHAHQPGACATVGHVQVMPNSRNVIPGRVFFTIDFRNPSDDALTAMDRDLRQACDEIAAAAGCTVEVKEFWYFAPTPFDPACIAAVRAGAERGGYSHRDIISGAGHDAVYLAQVAPTGMIFVPCEDGISHNEIENATPQDLAAGCAVLLHAVLARAVRG